MSRRPRRRTRQPRPSSANRSAHALVPSSGGTCSSTGPSTSANRARRSTKRGYASTSCADSRAGPDNPVGADRERPAVAGQSDRRHLRRREAQAVFLERQIVDQLRGHLVQQVRTGGNAIAGRELVRDRRAAHLRRSLQYQHRPASLRQVRGADQAVVTATDHDAVVTCCRRRPHGAHCATARPRSRSTARAAFAPGAPMTPPPGCVLDPHRYSPCNGVRYWA